MFFNYAKMKEREKELLSEIEDLKKTNEALEKKKRLLENELQDTLQQKSDIIADCECSVNFKTLNAFSIERVLKPKDGQYSFVREITNIGYMVNDKIHEWFFACSREAHERLVKEFNEYMAQKD
jgi:seryl-tRNA synthetase